MSFQLEVLTNLANETNISTILREFQVLGSCVDVNTFLLSQSLKLKCAGWQRRSHQPQSFF